LGAWNLNKPRILAVNAETIHSLGRQKEDQRGRGKGSLSVSLLS
jgi:hypothetical protein